MVSAGVTSCLYIRLCRKCSPMSSPLAMANQVCDHPTGKVIQRTFNDYTYLFHFENLCVIISLCTLHCTVQLTMTLDTSTVSTLLVLGVFFVHGFFPSSWCHVHATVHPRPTGSSYVAAPDGSRTPVSCAVWVHGSACIVQL